MNGLDGWVVDASLLFVCSFVFGNFPLIKMKWKLIQNGNKRKFLGKKTIARRQTKQNKKMNKLYSKNSNKKKKKKEILLCRRRFDDNFSLLLSPFFCCFIDQFETFFFKEVFTFVVVVYSQTSINRSMFICLFIDNMT